jgi:hypothetical protein
VPCCRADTRRGFLGGPATSLHQPVLVRPPARGATWSLLEDLAVAFPVRLAVQTARAVSGSMLTAARGEIERLNAEAATNAKIKEELAQQYTTAASFVQELTVARGEIERLKAEAAANAKVQEESPQPHTTAASLAQELAAARDEIERLRAEAGAAVERARFWRSRFVAELQQNEPAPDLVKSSSPAQARSNR